MATTTLTSSLTHSSAQLLNPMTEGVPTMQSQSALKLVFEALNLAAESGGELDHGVYVEAKQKLQALVDSIVKYDQEVDSEERSPDGNDYNELLSLLEINLPQ